MDNKQFKKVRAIFNPDEKHIDTLKPEMNALIGKEFNMMYAWLMDENDPFPGVWALMFTDNYESRKHDIGWIPEFDLDIIEIS